VAWRPAVKFCASLQCSAVAWQPAALWPHTV